MTNTSFFQLWQFLQRNTGERNISPARCHIICSSQQLSRTRIPISSGFATGNSAMLTLSKIGQSRSDGSKRSASCRSGFLFIAFTPGHFLSKPGFYSIEYFDHAEYLSSLSRNSIQAVLFYSPAEVKLLMIRNHRSYDVENY